MVGPGLCDRTAGAGRPLRQSGSDHPLLMATIGINLLPSTVSAQSFVRQARVYTPSISASRRTPLILFEGSESPAASSSTSSTSGPAVAAGLLVAVLAVFYFPKGPRIGPSVARPSPTIIRRRSRSAIPLAPISWVIVWSGRGGWWRSSPGSSGASKLGVQFLDRAGRAEGVAGADASAGLTLDPRGHQSGGPHRRGRPRSCPEVLSSDPFSVAASRTGFAYVLALLFLLVRAAGLVRRGGASSRRV